MRIFKVHFTTDRSGYTQYWLYLLWLDLCLLIILIMGLLHLSRRNKAFITDRNVTKVSANPSTFQFLKLVNMLTTINNRR